MVLTVHHLGISQSERIVFLCEELGIDYKLVKHTRDPLLAPASLKIKGNDLGKAPFIEDPEASVNLSESGAIVEYILAKHAHETAGKAEEKKLYKKYGEKGYVDYIYWFHYVNATLQPALFAAMFEALKSEDGEDSSDSWVNQRLAVALKHVDDRLANAKWLAGDDFTAADIMITYSLTTQRYYGPSLNYSEYKNIARYLQDLGQREGYKRAMEKGDPEMRVLTGVEAPEKSLLAEGTIECAIWKK